MHTIDASNCSELFIKFMLLFRNQAQPLQDDITCRKLESVSVSIRKPSDFFIKEFCNDYRDALKWLDISIRSAIAHTKFDNINYIETNDEISATIVLKEHFHVVRVQQLCLALCIKAATHCKKVGTLQIIFSHPTLLTDIIYKSFDKVIQKISINKKDNNINFFIKERDKIALLANRPLEATQAFDIAVSIASDF